MRSRTLASGLALMTCFALGACSGNGSTTARNRATSPSSASPSPSPSHSPTAATPVDPQLAHLLLTQAQVATAAREEVIPHLYNGGTSITDQATLDECGATYPSETRRSARIQVGYAAVTAGGQTVQTVSNEVVRYDIGGVDAAYRELTAALRNCPKLVHEGNGVTETDVQILPRDPQLVARQRTVVTALHRKHGGPVWLGATFLYESDLFDGVYTYEDTRAKAIHLVQALARTANQKLREAASAEGTSI